MTQQGNSEQELSREEQAIALLREPNFFQLFIGALKRERLVGEERNALILYLVALSSVLDDPLNVIIKGASSSGKNYLAKKVLRLIPGDAIRELTSSSETAWNYLGDCKNKIIYLQERNEAAGNVQPVRLLISDKKLIRQVTVRRRTETFVTTGPIASISTTTRNLIATDDENRNLSIWTDQSEEQTRKIALQSVAKYLAQDSQKESSLTEQEVSAWQTVYNLLKERTTRPVILAPYFAPISQEVSARSLFNRRYFPAFLEACRTIALIRSFRDIPDWQPGFIEVDFADYCVAAAIFEDVFATSLQRGSDTDIDTADAVDTISKSLGGQGVDATALAGYLGISRDRAYRRLQEAIEHGVIVRANLPERDNRKLYVRSSRSGFLPDANDLLQTVGDIPSPVEFVHPLTGQPTKYVRKTSTTANRPRDRKQPMSTNPKKKGKSA